MKATTGQQHQQAISAALRAIRQSVAAFAEARYPGDLLRQDVYAVIVCQDAGVAASIGARCGFGLSDVIKQVDSMVFEERSEP